MVRTRHRDELLAACQAAGVGAGVHYPIPLHLQPAWRHLGLARGDLPVTEAWADECLSLPLYPELTEAQQDHVVKVVRGVPAPPVAPRPPPTEVAQMRYILLICGEEEAHKTMEADGSFQASPPCWPTSSGGRDAGDHRGVAATW